MPAQQQPTDNYTSNFPKLHGASSNDTLNRFLAGTRRSWMAGSPPVKPTPRPKKPEQPAAPQPKKPEQPTPQKQKPPRISKQNVRPPSGDTDVYKPQTGPRPGVLPSPAPSDEPSPAVSMTHDSPNPVPASLPEFQPMNKPLSSVANANQLLLPVTEARFVLGSSPQAVAHAAAAEGNQTNGQAHNGSTVQSLDEPVSASDAITSTHTDASGLSPLRPSSTGQSTASAQAEGVQPVHTATGRDGERIERNTPDLRPQPAMSPTDVPQSGVRYPSMMLPASTSAHSHISNNEQPAKRRRIENNTRNPSEVDLNLLAAAGSINAYIGAEGGLDAFTKHAEQPRLQLLGNACRVGDNFFVALHQLSCMWTRNRAEVCAILDQDQKVIDAGFHVVELVLKKNSLIHPRHLNWMADFPARLPRLIDALQKRKQHSRYTDAISDVASFLHRASNSYWSLTQVFMARGYPYLVDELLGQLDCRSATLQYVLFTASRRRLGVPDGPLGQSLDQAFFEDQKNHQDQSATFLPMGPISDSTVLESRNSELIHHYKHIVAEATRARQDHRRRSSHLPVSSPSLQQALPPRTRVTSDTQTSQSFGPIAQASPNSAAVTSSAPTLHQPLTSTPTHVSPHPSPVSQFPTSAPGHPFASYPVQSVPQNLVLQSSSAAPQETGPPPGHPSQAHINISRQQPAIQSWMSAGQMANQQMTGQASPNLQGFQQVFPPQAGQRPAQQQQPQQNHQNLSFFEQQQRHMNANLAYHQQQHHQQQPNQPNQPNQQQLEQMIATHHAVTNQSLQQQIAHQQQFVRLQMQQQQAQLAASQRMMEFQTIQPVSPAVRTGVPGGQLQASFPSPQASVRPTIPTPGVSPIAPQFPSGARGQSPFVQQPLLSPDPASRFAMASTLQLQQRQQSAQVFGRFVPPPSQTIQLCDWPIDPLDKKAIMMSLHQADVRSPKRKVRPSATGEPDERYYQAVKALPVPPSRVAPMKRLYKFQFDVAEEQIELKSRTIHHGPGIPLAEHFDGSLRWRVRTCKIAPNGKTLSGAHEWVGMETAWPEHITIALNGEHIAIRRRTHNGRDQPSELTPFIRPGTNELVIALAEPKKRTADQYAVAVEIVETRGHSAILDYVWKNGVSTEDETLKKIKSRMAATHDDDSVSIVVKDLSIDIADPFSRVMFKIPARGAHCTHMECFDLETWLETRPSKTLKCPHSAFVPCTCNDQPEPSVADKWKCPICNEDARPYSLRIDSFLLNVRKQLEEENKLKAKSILVAADGTWQAVVEDDDDDDDDSDDDDEPRAKSAGATQSGPSATPIAKKPVEVIELLDD